MDQNHEAYYYADLLVRRLRGELSAAEDIELNQWINKDPENKKLLDMLESEELLQADLDYIDSIQVNKAWDKVIAQTNQQTFSDKLAHIIRIWKYAAILIVALAVGIGYYYQRHNTPKISRVGQYKNDIAPGTEGAILTLANGLKVTLSGAHGKAQNANGLNYDEQGFVSCVLGNGRIRKAGYNTITAPLGYTYKLILPDGSRVWLNSSSSIKFPVVFGNDERHVYLTGEAYFEVAKNKHKPFRVSANNAVVQVLGTHFNVKAYKDETALKATLLEGSIKIVKGNESRLIVPGQQASINNNSTDISVNDANIDESIAWKNDRFLFDSEDIKSVMQQLARWYNVQVEYEGAVPEFHFSGGISRKNNISQILKMLELTGGVHFEIEGRKVTVTR
jgi:transmembrane sensor